MADNDKRMTLNIGHVGQLGTGVRIAAGSTVAFPPLSLLTIPFVASAWLVGRQLLKHLKK